MTARKVTIRLAAGDFSGGSAIVRVRAGANAPVELILHSGKSLAIFEFDDAAAAERPKGAQAYSFEVEYRWGYAREA